jgi:hypothetical protein
MSVMNPEKQWPILAMAVALAATCASATRTIYMAPGEFARNNAVLVERMVIRAPSGKVATPTRRDPRPPRAQ